MRCRICHRQARGFGHLDGRFQIADPRRYPLDWVFCSLRCLDAFHNLYEQWRESKPPLQEKFMIEPTDMEIQAMRACLKAFGEAAGEIGFDKPLGTYSEEQALRVINAIVTGYVEAMAAAHAATRHPPLHFPPGSDPFAGMSEDLPWETK